MYNDFYPGDSTGTNTNGTDTNQMNADNRNNQASQWNGGAQWQSGPVQEAAPVKRGAFVKKVIGCIVLGLFFGLFAGVGFYGVQYATGGLNRENDQAVQGNAVNNQGGIKLPGTDGAENLSGNGESSSGIKLTDTTEIKVVTSDVSKVAEEVMPAMVSIINNSTQTEMNFWGQTYNRESASSGSGFIVGETDKELLIVSNHHVVTDADKLEVTFIDGSKAEAQIKGLDSDMDLAVIAIPLKDLSDETKAAIAIATMGDSDALKLGQPVVAIGNALGYGQSVTDGVVSALNREIPLSDGSTGTFIQTNAAINPGNSGGALLNVNGEVIGINSNKIGGSTVEGMGYAIPISAAKPIIEDLMNKETRSKVDADKVGYMGISMQTVPNNYSQAYGMPAGVYITSVEDGSPAKTAGLQMGDIIVKFEGEKITAYQDLQNVLQYYAAGAEVKVSVQRIVDGEYQTKDIVVTLGERPRDSK